MNRSSESGSHIIALALIVLFVAVAGFSAYKVWTMQQTPVDNVATTTTAATTVPAKITNAATLSQTSTALDSDLSQMNNDLNDSSLSADLNSML
jgi:hypothetical protein